MTNLMAWLVLAGTAWAIWEYASKQLEKESK